MKQFSAFVVLPLAFLLLDACSVQDHQPGPDPASCQVLTFTVIEKSARSEIPYWQPLDETAELDGQPVQIGTKFTNTYTFDEQNRLSQSIFDPTGNFPTTVLDYYYEPGFMKGGYQDLKLNEQGLLADVTDSQVPTDYTYDANGFLIKRETEGLVTTFTIQDGNVVKEESVIPVTGAKVIYEYEYDLTRPNLPNIAPQEGKVSKNLPIKRTRKSYNQPGDEPFVSVYDYKYVFDKTGRVIRRYYLDTEVGIPYYIVTDYAYTCR